MSQVNITTNTSKVEVNTTNNQIVVTNPVNPNTVSITQPVTTVVEVITVGPQGPPGLIPSTGSFVTTSSFNAFTSSYNTGSFTGSFTGSLFGTVTTASYYLETDPVFTAKSGSLATTGSNIFIGNQTITGSLTVSSSNATQLLVGTNTLFVSSSGNVGIGTTNPIHKLDISANSGRVRLLGTTGFVALDLQNSANSFYVAREGSSGGSFATGTSAYAGVLSVQGAYSMHLATNGIISTTINSSGNVGIGKTNPSTALDVSGSVSVTGSLLITGSTTVAGNIIPVTDIAYDLGTTSKRFNNVRGFKSEFTYYYSPSSTESYFGSGTNNAINFPINNLVYGKFAATTGNLLLQNGGAIPAFSDNGYRLQIRASTGSLSGSLYTDGFVNHTGTISSSVAPTNNPSASLMVIGGTTIQSASILNSSAVQINPIMSASANSQTLIGLDINPTFNTGSFTGVSKVGFRLGGTRTFSIIDNTYPLLNSTGPIGLTAQNSVVFYADTVSTGIAGRALSSVLSLGLASTTFGAFLSTTGNFALQNGGAFTDDGINRLQVSGSARITNGLTVTGSLLISSSAGMTVDGINIGRGGGYVSTNTVVGSGAGQANTIGTSNTFIGYGTGAGNTTGVGNTALGLNSLGSNVNGGQNVALGNFSLQNNQNSQNTAVGYAGLINLNSGAYNTVIGNSAGRYIANGSTNATIINNSIFIGALSYPLADNQTNQIVIGYNSTGLGNNTTVLGNTSTLTTAIYGDLLLGTTSDSGTEKLQVVGNTKILGQTTLSGSQNTASGSILKVIGSGSQQPIFTVLGSQGELFSITDSLSGSLFSVNDISGLPILEVFSDNTTLIGNYQAPALVTTAKNVLASAGAFTVYSLPTASYDGAFFEYTARSGSNARAGQIMAIWSGSVVNYTETTSSAFGTTTGLTLGVFITGSNMALTGSATTSAWTIKTIIRSI